MPLDAQDRQESVDNSFRYVVGSILDDGKPFSGRADSLVMGAVYGKISSVEPAQKGAGQGVAGMDLILAGILVQGVGGEILDDAAAEKDIDNCIPLQIPRTGRPDRTKASSMASCCLSSTGSITREP